MPACSHCGAPDASSRCGQCLETVYCGRECQRAHWKAGHKALCAASEARLKAHSAALFGAGGEGAAAAAAGSPSALSVRELKAALSARGVSTADMLDRADLEAALARAPPLPPPPPGAAGAGGAPLGGSAGGGSAAILTGSGLVDAGDVDMASPLSRAEFLELCQRTGRPSPTAGDAMAFGMLSMRLAASAEGDHSLARFAVQMVKATEGFPPDVQEQALKELLDEHGTTRGIKGRASELKRKVALNEERRKRAGL